jgi:hypothetical protein
MSIDHTEIDRMVALMGGGNIKPAPSAAPATPALIPQTAPPVAQTQNINNLPVGEPEGDEDYLSVVEDGGVGDQGQTYTNSAPVNIALPLPIERSSDGGPLGQQAKAPVFQAPQNTVTAPAPAPTGTFTPPATNFMAAMAPAQPMAQPMPPKPSPKPSAPATAPQPQPQSAPPPQSVAPKPTSDNGDMAMWQQIQAEVTRMKHLLGICAIESPEKADKSNIVHEAIYFMRHNPQELVQKSPEQLNIYEAALSAHQVYVQTVENEWKMKFTYISRERDRALRARRGNYKGDTEKAREDAAIISDPSLKKIHFYFLMAQAISTLLDSLGERFAQLEDGLKRTISMRQDEMRRTAMQAKYQA